MARRPERLDVLRRTLGTRLAELRRGARLSQAQLAELLHYNRTSITHIERGRQLPDRSFWVRVDGMLQAAGELVSTYDHLAEMTRDFHARQRYQYRTGDYGSDNTAARVRSYAATGRALAAGETSEIMEVGTVGADEPIAARLGVEPGAQVHVRRRLIRRDGSPVHVSSSYYPSFVVAATPELAEPTSTGASRELAAERLGATQGRVLEEVTSRLATDPEKTALGLTGSVIVTQVLRTVFLTDGRVIEVAVKVSHGSTVLRWSTALDVP